MRITIVQGAFFPVPPVMGGAVEKVWYELGRAFAQRGHDVTHVSRSHPNLPDSETNGGVTYHRVAGYDAPRSLALLKALDLLYSLRVVRVLPPADILVSNTFWLPVIAPLNRYGRIYVHVARYPKGQLWLYRKAARLQTVSRAIAEVASKQSPRLSERVRVIPYFVPDVGNSQPAQYLRREKKLLYVGRIHPEKGIGLLLKAFDSFLAAGHRDWKLVVVGPWQAKYGGGGDEYYAHLQRSSASISSQIDWVGSMFEPSTLNSFYGSASLFVYPSLAEYGETFGLAPLEAMANGCPPVVSALTCFSEFIDDGRNGWIFDHRAKDASDRLASKLIDLARDEQVRAAAGSEAIKTARRFSVDAVASCYLRDFEEIIRGHHLIER